jgi:hypothetical protein
MPGRSVDPAATGHGIDGGDSTMKFVVMKRTSDQSES